MSGVIIRDADTASDIELARTLFLEYAQALGFSLASRVSIRN